MKNTINVQHFTLIVGRARTAENIRSFRTIGRRGGLMGRAARVRALAGVIALCSWARHLTLTVPLSTQVYKRVPANLMLGVTLRWTNIPSRGGGVEILPVASCYRNRDKLRPDGPPGSSADFTLPFGQYKS